MSFLKNEGQEGKNRSCLGVGTSGRGENIKKGYRRRIWWNYYVLTYENVKMRPVETILRMGGIREWQKG
jgi:hypothetical protein